MDATPLLAYFKRYVSLSEEEEIFLLSKVKLRKYLKGQYVLQQGDVCSFENFVLSGCLKTFHIDPNGQEHIVLFAIEDWWTGDLGSFLTQTPSSFNIQCLEPCELAQISQQDLEELYLKIPKVERFFRIIIQKAYVASQNRIVANFSMPAKERYLKFRKQYPKIDQRVPQYMIASYLGITREFLSRIRSQLIHEQ
jgi:CRP-like cAMP-binding protein